MIPAKKKSPYSPPKKGVPMIAKYTDPEVVAAFNSCLDLKKYNQLPQAVKTRFAALIRACRVRPVCFMASIGFGLRVYKDMTNMAVTVFVDEAPLVKGTDTAKKSNQIDVDGVWVRCPANLYTDRQGKKPDEWIIMNETGLRFLEEENEEDTENLDETPTYEPDWTPTRLEAKTYKDKLRATTVANSVGGVVVKKS